MGEPASITNPETPQPARSRIRWWGWVIRAAAFFVLLAAGLVLYLQSAAFQETVRGRLITALQQSTGARVELSEFAVDWPRLEVTLRGLVLHGREASDAAPLFSAEWINLRWHLISFWSLSADLQHIRVLEPKVNLTVDEDGRSNLPPLPRATDSSGQWAAQLLALEIGHLELLRGEFRWNQRSLPLDLQAEQLQLRVEYEPSDDSYAGRIDFQDAALLGSGSAPLGSQGQLQFRLYSDRATIESFVWRTPKSHVTLQGTVNNFQSPQFEFRCDLLLDQAEAASILNRRGWEGDVAWKGQGSYAAEEWHLEGDLVARTRRNGITGWSNLPWTARGKLQAAPVRESAEDQGAASWQASLTDLAVTTLGGQLVGSATVRSTARGPETTLDFQAQRLSLTAMTEAMSALPVRLASLEWVGAASGPLHAQFVGMGRELKVIADWDVEAVAVVPPGFTSVSGKLSGSYDAPRKRVETSGSYIDLSQTHLSGEGWFDDHESQMRLTIQTTDLDENRKLASLLGQDLAALPLRLVGDASAEVDWTGGTQRARIAGDFRVSNFTYKDESWDRFAGQIDYQRGATSDLLVDRAETAPAASSLADILGIRSGELSRGDAILNFDLRMDLRDGGFSEDTLFDMQGRLRNVRAEELLALAGRKDPIRGIIQGSFHISGTRREPAGQGSISVSEGSYQEETVDRLSATIRLEPGGIWTAEEIRIEKAGGTLQGGLHFNQRTEELRFDLSGSEIELASIPALQGTRLRMAGIAEGSLSGQGTLDRPQLRGEIRLRQFGFGLAEPGSVTIAVESREGRAYWTMSGALWNGEVSVKGETILQGLFPSVADVNFERVDLPPLVKVFRDSAVDLRGELSGTMRAEGNAKDLSGFKLAGELATLQATVNQVGVRSIGSVPFQYQDQLLRLERLRLEGPRAELETAGTVLLGPDPVLNLNARGQMDLTALTQEDSELLPQGRVQLDAQISGTVQHPLWRGRLLISDGSLHYGSLPNGLERINGTVVFEGNRGVLENVTAESGGGRLQLSGFVRYGGGAGWQFNLAGDASGIRVRYPEGLSTWVNGRLSWTGTLQDSLLEGRVVLTRQSVSPQFDLVQVLLQRREETSPAAMPEILRNMRVNLEVSSASDLRLDTLTTRNLQTAVELRIQGTVAQPAWLGRIGILEGEILFAGKRYAINRGEISFVNPFRFEPVLSLSVQARVQRYDIAMDFAGPADRLTVTYRSDPPLPTSDILALLVAGSARDTSLETSTNQPLPEVGAEALLSQALQSQIGSRLDRLFGSGRLRVDPQISGLGRSTNASVALEQQLSDDISVLYITDVTSTQQQTVQAEWNISPKLSVVAIRDQNGLVGVNFQITLRFR